MRLKPDGLTPNGWAVQAGVSRTVWSDMRRHGNPSRRTLEKLLAAAGSSLAEFEALRVGPDSRGMGEAKQALRDAPRRWNAPPLAPLPLIAARLGGEWGKAGSRIELTEMRADEILEQVPRPASLAFDADAFALTVVGDSMWPRFRPGTRIAVSPRAPVAIGDDVLVRVRGGVLIKQLVRKSAAGVELRQFNPDLTFQVDSRDAEAILKVAGELI